MFKKNHTHQEQHDHNKPEPLSDIDRIVKIKHALHEAHIKGDKEEVVKLEKDLVKLCDSIAKSNKKK